jgi:hypothetical protein
VSKHPGVQARASELLRQLESELLDGGLEVRAGVYDEADA